MKTYFVKTDDVDALQSALGRMIEYAEFMAGEFGSRDRVAFVHEILDDCNIEVETEETD